MDRMPAQQLWACFTFLLLVTLDLDMHMTYDRCALGRIGVHIEPACMTSLHDPGHNRAYAADTACVMRTDAQQSQLKMLFVTTGKEVLLWQYR